MDISRRAGRFAWIGAAFVLVAFVGRSWAQTTPAAPAKLSEDRADALARIKPDSMRGHLSFLASDLLEGRDTPSRGLDIAAEYIAAQFRRAGLEPIGDSGYFQTAKWRVVRPVESGSRFAIEIAGTTTPLEVDRLTLPNSKPTALALEKIGLIKADPEKLDALTKAYVEGRALLVDLPDPAAAPPAERAAAFMKRNRMLTRIQELAAALVVSRDRVSPRGRGFGPPALLGPADAPNRSTVPSRIRGGAGGPTVLTVHDPEAIARLDALEAGTPASVTAVCAAPREEIVELRNVAGLLRGSDPALADTYVLVTAHYDHVGIGPGVKGDRIYNGANDDGSGTVTVVELASALGALRDRPKRSILFLTFFGEEKGLLGSRYYGSHPLVPIDKTVADINLEQVGRTDSTEGPQVARASMTGIDYSDVGAVFIREGAAEGVAVVKHPTNSDRYFGASDNQALADLGVPAHTLCVAFQYDDYHGPLDHWEKIDYVNMAKIARVTARALLAIADDPAEPKWNADNPRAKRYKEALERRKAAPAK
ncbi:MAG: M28 family peptidase [Isosphaeraceae bacterium]|nr:M28 family peptidase [Isosphaeraceae bacterium]